MRLVDGTLAFRVQPSSITVLFLRLLSENLQYQGVIKGHAVPGEVETVSRYISLAISRHSGMH